jgi:outer membrane receptor protein involved in Fe transport
MVFSAGALAQSVAGLGAVSGTVRDSSGAVVPAASVVIFNDSKGIKRTMESTEAGVFTAPALEPAPGYGIIVRREGFRSWEVKNFEILVGQTVDFKVALEIGPTSTQVVVTGEAPLVEDTKTGVSQVVEKLQIDNLPINGRRADTFVLLTPAVTDDGTFGLVSFRGIAGGNAFLTDGNDTTQSFYNENAGRTRISTQISQDAVQEFQVLSNGFSAEFGKALGGVINTITRSGTNEVHGTGYWFFRNRTLNATDRYANGINAPEWRHQAGGTLGGAIKKDQLFYFGNFEMVKRDFPAQNRIINNSFTDTTGNFITAACTATQAQCDTATSFIMRQMNVMVPRTVGSYMGFAKLDWRPTERNTFTFSANVMHWRSPHGIQTQAVLTNGNALGNNGNSTVETRYGKAGWTSIPTNSSVNEFRFGWFKDRLADPAASDLFPQETGALGISLSGTTIGAATSYPRVLPSEQRFQFVDNYSLTKGAHSAKFGIDLATTEDYINQLVNQFGTYSYGSLTNFAKDFSGNSTGGKNYTSFSQAFGNPILDFRTTDYGFYAQDVWKLSKKLTLNYGLRYEYASLAQPAISNPDYPQTSRIPSPTTNFAPRFSVSYSLSDRTVLRAGYGIFFARFHGAALDTLYLQNAKYQSSYSVTPTFAGSPVFPNILPDAAGLTAGTVSLSFAGNDFRNPYTQQGSIAIEHEFRRDTGITASYIWNRGIGLFTVRDVNLGSPGAPVAYTILDASGNTASTWTTPLYLLANRVDPRYRGLNMVENGGQSWYNGLALQIRKRMSHGLQASVSYTWSHAIDTANQGGASDSLFVSFPRSTYPGDYTGDKGSSTLDQRHRAVINFLWSPRFVTRTSPAARYLINGWQLSAITTMASAHPSAATVNISSSVPGLAWTSTLNGSGGSNRVPYWPFNPIDIDQQFRVDARIQRELPFSERVKANLSFEAFNAFNTQYNTAVNQQAFSAAGLILKPTANLGSGTQAQGFPDGTYARRMQVGLRFIF